MNTLTSPRLSSRAFAASLLLLLAQPLTLPAQPGHTAGLAALDDVPGLIAILQQPDAPLAARARACQQLSLVAKADAVPALAAWLADAKLSHYARTALEQIPDPAASAALRKALDSAPEPLQVGIIHSLGIRRDPDAVPALLRLLDPGKPSTASAALIALANIGTPAARDALRRTLRDGPATLRPTASEACLRLAEHTQDAELFDAVLQSEAPAPIRLAATRGLILRRGPAGVPLLLDNLRSPTREQQNLALRVVRELREGDAPVAVARALAGLPPSIQPRVVRALADTGHAQLAPLLEPLAASASPDLRLAALESLGTLGTDSSITLLVGALTRGAGSDPRESEVATASLSRLKAPGTDAALLAALRTSPADVQPRLIALLGQRGATRATDDLLALAAAPQPDVGRAAFEALALLAKPTDIPKLVEALGRTQDAGTRDRAEKAIYNLCLKIPDAGKRSEPLSAALATTRGPETRGSLLQVLAMLGDPASCTQVAQALEDATPAVRDTALRLLSHWNDATAVPTLLKVFKSTPDETHRGIALQGIVTLATQSDGEPAKTGKSPKTPSPQAIAWLKEANGAVRNQTPEKRVIISGLGDLNCLEGIQLLQPYLDDAAVRSDAVTALLRASRGLVDANAKAAARPLLERLTKDAETTELRQQAGEVLQTLNR